MSFKNSLKTLKGFLAEAENLPYELLDKKNGYKSTGEEASDVDCVETVDYILSDAYNFHRRSKISAEEEAQQIRKMVEIVSARNEPKFTSLYGKLSKNWNYVLIPGFYLLLGLFLSTNSLAIKLFAIEVLNIDPGMFGFLYTVVVMPWFMKPFFGLMSDKMPFFGRHRSPYLVFCSFCSIIVWILLAIPGQHSRTSTGFGLLLLFSNIFMCFSDVVVDCMLAKEAREEIREYKAKIKDSPEEAEKLKGRAQSRAWLCRNVGSVCGILLGGYLVWQWPTNLHIVFGVTAIYPAILFFGSFFLREDVDPIYVAINEGNITKNHHRINGLKAHGQMALISCSPMAVFREIRNAFEDVQSNDTLRRLAKFIFLVNMMPSSGFTFSYFLRDELKFSDFLMAAISIVGVFASLFGLSIYFVFLKTVPIRKLIRSSITSGVLLTFIPMILVTRVNIKLSLPDELFALGDDVIGGFITQLIAMPLMITMAAECPDKQEGLFYSGMLALSNFGGAVSIGIGAVLTHLLHITKKHYENMWILVFICAMSNIIPFFFVHWVPENIDKEKPEKLINEQEPNSKIKI